MCAIGSSNEGRSPWRPGRVTPRGTTWFLIFAVCTLIAGHLFATYLYFEVGVERYSEEQVSTAALLMALPIATWELSV